MYNYDDDYNNINTVMGIRVYVECALLIVIVMII